MGEGYIAVVLPKLHEVDKALSELMTEADYEVLLKQYKISGPGMGDDESIGKNDETQGTMSPGGNV
jgi:hypothetical protein